jgi:hypothetical protein
LNCEDIRDKLIDYIDGALDKQEEEIIKIHLKECERCRLELEQLQSITSYIENKKPQITTPNNLIENIKDKLNNKPGFKMKKRGVKVSLIVAAIAILLTVTVLAAEELNLSLKWWQKISVKQNEAVEQLIQAGYGQAVNLSAVDNNIKITIENVIGDDLNTLVSYRIEDLQKKEKYKLNLNDGIKVDGDFNNEHKKFFENIGGSMNFYSDIHFVERGCIKLEPVTKKQSMIHFSVNKINKYGSTEATVNGKWVFNIPVAKYDSKTYTLNKAMTIDEHELTFEEITIAPTATILKYKYKENSAIGYSIDYFSNIMIISNGKEYGESVMGSNSSISDGKGWNEYAVEFDTIYTDDPENIKIRVGKYGVTINNFKRFNIDMNKTFPQEFEYMGSKIIIESIKIEQDTAEVIITESLDNRNYENIDMEFKCENNIFTIQQGKWDGYVIDKNGTKMGMYEGVFAGNELNEPKSYITKRNITIRKAPPIERQNKAEKIIPKTLDIRGHSETIYIDKSIKVKLQ